MAPHYPLALDRVRFVGEGIVLVVAETLATAREAAELVEVEYEVLAASSEGVDAAEPGAARIWPKSERAASHPFRTAATSPRGRDSMLKPGKSRSRATPPSMMSAGP